MRCDPSPKVQYPRVKQGNCAFRTLRLCTRRMTENDRTPLLDTVNDPADLRRLGHQQLCRLADELRAETVAAAAKTGGHFGAGLGVVELTVALHYVFNTPADRLIWDVSHQSYPHMILTGRRSQ